MFFIPATLYLVALGWTGLTLHEPNMVVISAIMLFWVPMFIRHARNAFPSRDRLIHREREAWEVLQLHLDQLIPDKKKRKEKPKREISYRLSDDGELIEEEETDTIDWWNEDPTTDASTGL